ncbi:Acetyl-CoA carboxylase 1 [Camellia lanceoleosa]|uniref:Acetyl-CoA carboxylase 1 n=1 Tax=Camellia lanceoleosa TaxID=1840588 RepID=A0ACC0HJZ7_9ERIC|nr:Acetyl-CoA carboxylase 1 [Camellia lanceoleosa]
MSEAQRRSLMVGVGRLSNGFTNGPIPLRSSTAVSQVNEFCDALGGKKPIHSILVANNGMAAVKFIRSIRTWAYETFGTEKAILLVAMATPEDMRINAEHIRIADQFVEVPGGTNNNNYANVQLIVEMAEITHVDAVWPGWGHASENPELPDALTVKIPPKSCLVTIPDDTYRKACVYTTEEAISSCQVVGYPAMVKASWGGGGKGIRKVHNDDEVRALFKQVQGEVPGSPIFIMKLASLIIEEGPITVAPLETVKKLEQAARRLAKCVNYVGAATVEYLYSMDTGEYYFLELNPRLQELSFKSKPNVWAYFSVKSGGGIHEFSDSQFGHIFSFGESRALAVANMVLGTFSQASNYKDNKIHTGWLDSRIAMRKASTSSAAMVSEYVGYLEKGQIPPKCPLICSISLVNSQVSLNIEGSKYTIDMVRGGPGSYRLKMNQSEIEAEIHTLRDGGLLMQLDGNSHVIYAEEEAAGTRLLIDGRTCLLQNDHDPSKLVAETPCKLLRYLVLDSSHVEADIPFVEVEVMKMCMPLLSPASGIIHFLMSEGQAMQAGELIARLDLDDPSAVRKAEPFHGSFPILGPPTAISEKVHQRCAASLNAAQMILAGYEHNIDEVVQNLLSCLDNPELPFLQWQECLSVLATRLPKDLRYELESKYKMYEGSASFQNVDFPAKVLRGVLEAHLNSCPANEKGAQERLVEPLMSLVKSYEGGRESHVRVIVLALFVEYLSVEELFNDNIQADVIERLRLQYKKDLLKVLDIVLSHQGIKRKNKLILRLMEQLVYPNPAAYRDKLIRFSALNHTNYSELALKASQLLEQTKLSELRSSIARSLSELEMFTEDGENMDTPKRKSAINERMEDLVSAPLAVEDALVGLFDHSDHTLQRRVVETYVRRLYQPYLIKGSVRMQWNRSGLIASWEFLEEHIERKNGSEDQMSDRPLVEKHTERKWGAMVIIKSLQFLPTVISATLRETTHNMHDSIQNRSIEPASYGNMMRTPMRHSFHWSAEKLHYEEEPLITPLGEKLKCYENIQYTPSRDRQWHLYTVVDKPLPIHRMFLRTLVRQSTSNEGFMGLDMGMNRSQLSMSFTSRSILRSLMTAMEELELHVHNATIRSDHAHMYLYILREQQINDLVPYTKRVEVNAGQEEAAVEMILEGLAHEIHASIGVKMHRLGVCVWEVKLWMASAGQANGAWRVVVENVTGHTCIVHIYRELEDNSKQSMVYHSTALWGPLHSLPVNEQYQPLGALDRKRLLARKSNTTYCYDFPLAFETALEKSWALQFPGHNKVNRKVLKVTELIFADRKGLWDTPLISVERPPGLNDVGMVAWTMEMSTPEFPSGRTILIVANDVTFRAGSFGPREDAFFLAVSDLACVKKLPLIYLAANSGARIEVAEEVKACFKVGWSNELCPESGFQYVYLTPEDHLRISSSVIAHELKLSNRETRWIIDSIIGKEDGLGVENLSGSGAIASAYSRAYKETFTLTYVTGRTVGIGAYLARLGMRCIQRLDQPIILTGFSALNKLLGREVYSSHMQLGGPKIMATNGVVHLTVSDDLEGVSAILKWLSYVPPYSGGPLPILSPSDPLERPVEYFPENSCDPRGAICGMLDGTGKWLGGIFDKDSFVETLEGWARTVVTGRAKLGGIPVGIVAVETQTVMQVIPADPGQLDSHERVVPQAGQVWFPDSATKTAQALMDFNREELPLFILANWRGFSGGQRDLFEGILQAGSTIVENLRTYKQPVFVYIPMMGELRGGAWVVVDSRINSDHIEMYAERTAKGNVLEPEGMIEIKFRMKELMECMGRLDQRLIDLKARLQEARSAGAHANVESLQQQIKGREKQLLPVYTQIAMKFAELHDTSLRMAAKGVIREVVEWGKCRFFFYKRLHRRVVEGLLIKTVRDAAGDQVSHKSAMDMIKKWFLDSKIAEGREDAWANDEAFFTWKDDPVNYEEKLHELRIQKVLIQLSNIGDSPLDLQALPKGLAALLQKVEPSSRAQLVDELRKVIS